MQLEVKTLLNRIQHFAGFVYHEVRLTEDRKNARIEVADPAASADRPQVLGVPSCGCGI